MATDASLIANELADVFPSHRTVCFDPMVGSSLGEEPALTARAFHDKDDWTALKPAWLDAAPDGYATALSFLSDEAICFYIPAFLAADLRGELRCVEPSFHLSHGFNNWSSDSCSRARNAQTWRDYATQRWSFLTTAQARVIVQYLEWRIAHDDTSLASDLQDALSTFWYERASGREVP